MLTFSDFAIPAGSVAVNLIFCIWFFRRINAASVDESRSLIESVDILRLESDRLLLRSNELLVRTQEISLSESVNDFETLTMRI